MVKGFELLEHSNTRDDLLKYREQGALRGAYLGFPLLHEIYTMSLPGCTDFTGIPQSGKTEFLVEMLLNTSLFYGWKHFMYVPDIGDKNEILANIIHKITGKTFDKRYQSNYIDAASVEKELQWVLEHFKILTKVDLKAKITPYEFWEMAAQMKREYGVNTATIDSWKDMKHDMTEFNGREDKYLADVLGYRNSMAEAHKMHFHTVIHPLKTEKEGGIRKAPGPYDLKGGPEWFDNGKCIVTVHRVDGSPNKVEVIVHKAKPKSVAKIGKVEMSFNLAKSAYYWEYNSKDVYAKKEYFKPTGLAISDDGTDDGDIPF